MNCLEPLEIPRCISELLFGFIVNLHLQFQLEHKVIAYTSCGAMFGLVVISKKNVEQNYIFTESVWSLHIDFKLNAT